MPCCCFFRRRLLVPVVVFDVLVLAFFSASFVFACWVFGVAGSLFPPLLLTGFSAQGGGGRIKLIRIN